jgi:hypothetical protein
VSPALGLDILGKASVVSVLECESGMTSHQQASITRLFAIATSLAAAAHDASCDGQAKEANGEHYLSAVRRLLSAVHDLQAIADFIETLIDQLDEDHP